MNKEMYTVIGVGVVLAAILITSLGGLRAEMRDEFSTMRDDHAAIRAEMREGQALLRTEIREGFAAVRTVLSDMRADLARLGERGGAHRGPARHPGWRALHRRAVDWFPMPGRRLRFWLGGHRSNVSANTGSLAPQPRTLGHEHLAIHDLARR